MFKISLRFCRNKSVPTNQPTKEMNMNIPQPYNAGNCPLHCESEFHALMEYALELHGVKPPTTPEMSEFRAWCDARS